MRHTETVVLVSSSFHPYVGGVEQHVRCVARLLRERGQLVTVWTVDRGEHLRVGEVDGVTVRYLPTPLPARSIGACARFASALPGAAWQWLRAYRADRPKILHVQCFGPNGVYAVVLATLTSTPLIVSSHGETVADDHGAFDNSALLRRALSYAVGRATVVTGCSQTVVSHLRDNFGARGGVVVPNGVDLAIFSERVQRDEHLIFAVGRLEWMKGFDLLIAACGHPSTPSSARLVIAGEGSAREELEQAVVSQGLEERVSFVGRLEEQEVAAMMAEAALIVIPSRWEAFGIVLLEAWRAETPVIATNRAGPASLVRDGVDGVLVDPEDTAALADAIRDLLRDRTKATRLGSAGKARVQGFSWENTVDQYEESYRTGTPRSSRSNGHQGKRSSAWGS